MKLTPRMFRSLPRPLSKKDSVICEECGREEKVVFWEFLGEYGIPEGWEVAGAEGGPVCPECLKEK